MDFRVNDDLPAELLPQAAVVLYGTAPHSLGYASYHRVEGGRLGAGVPLTRQTLHDALQALAPLPPCWLEPRVLMVGHDRVAWWRAARPARLYFDTPKEDLAALSGQEFPQPPLLFLAAEGRLRVWALPANRRPRPATRLLCAPYYNTYGPGGQVCLGSAAAPASATPASIDAWEGAFFAAAFSHAATLTTRYKGSHAQMWQEARERGRFDRRWLTPAGVSAGEALGL